MKVIPHFVFHSLNVLNFDETVDWLVKIYNSNFESILKYISYDFLSMPKMLNSSFLSEKCKENILNESNYFKKELSDFFDTNKFNFKHISELKKFVSFLNLRSEIPFQSKQVIQWST